MQLRLVHDHAVLREWSHADDQDKRDGAQDKILQRSDWITWRQVREIDDHSPLFALFHASFRAPAPALLSPSLPHLTFASLTQRDLLPPLLLPLPLPSLAIPGDSVLEARKCFHCLPTAAAATALAVATAAGEHRGAIPFPLPFPTSSAIFVISNCSLTHAHRSLAVLFCALLVFSFLFLALASLYPLSHTLVRRSRSSRFSVERLQQPPSSQLLLVQCNRCFSVFLLLSSSRVRLFASRTRVMALSLAFLMQVLLPPNPLPDTHGEPRRSHPIISDPIAFLLNDSPLPSSSRSLSLACLSPVLSCPPLFSCHRDTRACNRAVAVTDALPAPLLLHVSADSCSHESASVFAILPPLHFTSTSRFNKHSLTNRRSILASSLLLSCLC